MRRALRLSVVVATVLGSAMLVGNRVVAVPDTAPSVQVTIDAVGPTGVNGLAIFSAANGGTAVQVLAIGAAVGAIAIIHAGTCEVIDPAPVGLLGDIGSTGQIQTTVPLALATLADGAHVIAIHAGLDLGSTLGCGAIPAVVVPSSPVPAGSPGVGLSNTYLSPSYGYRLAWSSPWEPMVAQPTEGVALQDGVSSVTVTGRSGAAGTPAGCVSEWEGGLLVALREGRIAGLGPVTGSDGQPIGGGDDKRARGAYRYDVIAGDQTGMALVEAIDCRRSAPEIAILILQVSPEASYAAEAVVVDALLLGLTLGEPSATPPPAVETPAPTVAPAASTSTDCDAIGAWISATLARLDRVTAIANDLNDALNGGIEAYAEKLGQSAALVQDLVLEQGRGPVPEAATTLDQDMRDALRLLVTTYDLLADAYRTGNAADLQEGLGKANQVEQKVTDVRRGIRDLATPCGIRITT